MSYFEPPETAAPDPIDAPEGKRWWRLTDFRAGIHSDVSANRPPGHAQPTNTFQCYASRSGSLIPAPRLVDTITRDVAQFGGLTATNLLSEQIRICGVYANAPVYSHPETNINTHGTDECHAELWFAFEYWIGPDNDNASMRLNVSRYSRNKTMPHWGTAWTRAYNNPDLKYNPIVRPRNCTFASQRSNSAAPLVSGPQILAWVFSGNARYFPRDTDTTQSLTGALPHDQVDGSQPGGDNPLELIAPTYCLGHQGRVVIFPLYITGAGSNQFYVSSESAYWTAVNNVTVRDPNLTTPFNILGGYEHAAGYGVFASLTADELFFVKIRGGGMFVTGDLNSPTVRTLPQIRSTGLAFNNGCVTPHGYIYPIDSSGIDLWAGGDNSEHITRHLEADFWRPPALAPARPRDDKPRTPTGWGYSNTQCDAWNEFALIPNNWFWDTDERGWWRILDPDIIEIHRWAADDRGRRAWGTPSGIRWSTDPIAYEFDRLLGATYYSWQSHPQEPTIDSTTRIHEVVVCAQGHGTVRLTGSSAQDPNNPANVSVDVDSDRPVLIRANVDVSGTGLVWRIESWGADHDVSKGSVDMDATIDAPTVHYVDLCGGGMNQIPGT